MKILFQANRVYRAFARTVKWMTASVAGLFVIAFLLIQIPSIQNYIGQKIIASVSKDLNTRITVSEVAFNFHSARLSELTLYDQENDTLLSSDQLLVDYNLLPILSNNFRFGEIIIDRPSVHLKRNRDSLENYAFLLKYFGGSEKEGSLAEKNNKSKAKLKIKSIGIRHASFRMNDQVTGASLAYRDDFLHIELSRIDLENKSLEIQSLDVERPRIERKYIAKNSVNDSMTSTWPIEIPWDIKLNSLSVHEGQLLSKTPGAPPMPSGINPADLNISGIDIRINGIEFLNDSLSCEIENIALQEQSGFRIDSLSGMIEAGKKKIVFRDAWIQTPNSLLKEDISIGLPGQTSTEDFFQELAFDVEFHESKLAQEDILYFTAPVNAPKKDIQLDGRIYGQLSNLHGRDLDLSYGKVTRFQGDFTIMGLPNPEETFLDMSIHHFQSDYYELNQLLRFAELPPNTKKLGVSTFKGNFTGFLTDFVAYGTLNTAIGRLESDINMKIPAQGEPSYSGTLLVKDFDAGYYLDDPNMGRLSFNGHVSGESFDRDKLKAHIDGKVQLIEYLGYAYRDIIFAGEVEKRFLSGQLTIKDPNADLDFNGTVDFKTETPRFSATADIRNLNTKPLGLSTEKWKIRSRVTADIRGIDIDDLVGEIVMRNTEAYAHNSFFNLGTISLRSENYSLGKRMILESKIADARIDGNFKISTLAPAFLSYLSNYYPSLLDIEEQPAEGQDFMFELLVKKTNNFTDLLLPDVKGLEGIHISGNFNSLYKRLILTANVPRLRYRNLQLKNFDLYAHSTDDTLYFDTQTDELAFNKQLRAAQVIHGYVNSDKAFLNLKAFENELANQLLANLVLSNSGDSLELKIVSSTLKMAGKEWEINSENSLFYYDRNLYARKLEFKSGDEKIEIRNIESNGEQSVSGLTARMENVELGYWMDIANVLPYHLDGNIRGEINVFDLFEPAPHMQSNLKIDAFQIESEDLGELSLETTLNTGDMLLHLDAQLAAQEGTASASGSINVSSQALDLDVTANNAPFRILEPFLTGILTEMQGVVNGRAHLGGTALKPDMQGNMLVSNAEATLDYLKSRYYFDPLPIEFTNQSIYLKESQFRDAPGSEASRALIGGEIFMKNFNELEFRDFYVYTDHDFKFMETTESDNEYFYGTAYGKGIVLINGPINFLDIYINAVSDPGTQVSIPIQYESGVSQYQFVRFVNHREIESKEKKADESIPIWLVNFTMDLDITPAAEIQLIFDEKAGDIIKGRGEGSLKLKFNSEFDFEMYGGISIEEGEYLFTLQDIINKKFELEPGGTITWSGDPYGANLNLIAKYSRKVSAYNLVSDLLDQLSSTELQAVKKPGIYTVLLHMQGPLDAPEISFDIEAERKNELGNIISSRLQEIRNDENELNKQVFGLIVFNSFLPSEFSASSGSSSLVSSGVGTVTEFLSNQLSLYFNDWLSKYDFEVDFQYRNYEIGSNGEVPGIVRNALELELSKRIGRLSINVGGNFDFGNTSTSIASANNLAGDFSVEYSLTEDGRIRVRAFRDSEYDLFSDAYRNKGGVGLYFKKEFNSFKELFQGNPDKDTDKAALEGIEGKK